MSLVNTMLRDLEERQDQNGQPAGVSPALNPGSEPKSCGSKLAFTIGLGLFGCAAVLLSWHNQWWQPQAEIKPTVAIAEQPTPAQAIASQQPVEITPPIAEAEQPATIAQVEPEPVAELAPEPAPQAVEPEEIAVAEQPLPEPVKAVEAESVAVTEEPQASVAASAATQNRQAILEQAQQLATAGNLAGAAEKLESIQPDMQQHPGHYALLAGIYHKQGQHQQAAELYGQLVDIERDNAIYWLGLAVALDAMQDRNALGAFQTTRQLNSNPDVAAYVERRIEQLINPG